MIKKYPNAAKQGQCYTGGDPAPTWEDRLKNQMGYGQTSDLARKIHGKGDKIGAQIQEQLLSDLGVKTTTENYEPEQVEDRFAARGKKII